MAIYHLSVRMVRRSRGESVVAVAARRSGTSIVDERLSRTHRPIRSDTPVHSEILLPEGAPCRWRDRTALWNEIEVEEKRKDAQLARDIEISLPRELRQSNAVQLARDFVCEQFVAHGMVADLNVFWGRSADGWPQPIALILLTLRRIEAGSRDRRRSGERRLVQPIRDGAEGFGLRERAWNDRALLRLWRARWAEMANMRLADAGVAARIDHRSYAERGVALEPQNKIGAAALRRARAGEKMERVEEHAAIARRNAAQQAARGGDI